MRTETIKVLTVNELSEKAFEKAYNEWLNSFYYFWGDENEATLKAFAKEFNLSINSWEYDTCNGHVRFSSNHEETVDDLSGERLARYIYNNYKSTLYRGKYHSLKSTPERLVHNRVISKKSKRRDNGEEFYFNSYRSACFIEIADCPFTGYCMDCSILQPIYDFLAKPDNRNFIDLMQDCFDSWVEDCVADYRYSQSLEAFKEDAEANDWEFTEDGSLF